MASFSLTSALVLHPLHRLTTTALLQTALGYGQDGVLDLTEAHRLNPLVDTTMMAVTMNGTGSDTCEQSIGRKMATTVGDPATQIITF
jgi:hypothetical protein